MDPERPVMATLHCTSQFEYPSYVFDTSQKILCVTSVRAQAQELTRVPIDVCAVIDRSGSMAGDKLSLVKEATQFMVQQMSSVDRLSVVSFDNKVQDVYGGSGNMNFMTSGNKKVAAAAISHIESGGGTNLSAGLFRGIDHHQQLAAPLTEGSADRVRSVFLFTDGQSTTGLTDVRQIASIMAAMLQNAISPKIYTFGFGADLDDAMLNAISEEGNGQSIYMEDAESIPSSFASALGGLMSMAAQNLELHFVPKEGVAIHQVETGFKKTPQSSGSIKVAVGDLFSDEQKDFLLELDIPRLYVADVSEPVMLVQARYLDTSHACMRDESFVATVARTADTVGLRQSHPLVLEHVQRIEASNALQAASMLADQGNLSSARAVLNQSFVGINSGPVSARSRRLAADLSSTMEAFDNQQTYERQGRSLSSRFGREHARQQASVMTGGRESAYATGAQIRMSRMSRRPGDGNAAAVAQPHPSQTWQATQPAAATMQYNSILEVAVPRQTGGVRGRRPKRQQRQGAGSPNRSTATLPYAPDAGRVSGHKRAQEQTANASSSEARSSPATEGGYNTRAKYRRESDS
ncbi:hypothetical protein WJX77_010279 [Trebouxia sp. C0004]